MGKGIGFVNQPAGRILLSTEKTFPGAKLSGKLPSWILLKVFCPICGTHLVDIQGFDMTIGKETQSLASVPGVRGRTLAVGTLLDPDTAINIPTTAPSRPRTVFRGGHHNLTAQRADRMNWHPAALAKDTDTIIIPKNNRVIDSKTPKQVLFPFFDSRVIEGIR